VTEEEIRAASLQFVRKVSGFNKPSKVNEAAFDAAVDEISAVSEISSTLFRRMHHQGSGGLVARREHAAGRGFTGESFAG
jgi:hypothetical protein